MTERVVDPHGNLTRIADGYFDVAGGSVTVEPERTLGRSFRCATRGLREAWQNEPNFRLQITAALMVALCGLLVRLSLREWTWIAVAAGFVLVAELVNTAIERVVDLAVGFRADPLARQTKDLSAGFVLVASVAAAVVGLLIFLPHVMRG